MIDKQLRRKLAQRKLIISATELMHFDSCSTRFIKSGSKCNFRCLGVLISC
jgi:hypothetical protein